MNFPRNLKSLKVYILRPLYPVICLCIIFTTLLLFGCISRSISSHNALNDDNSDRKNQAKVAPIFIHGKGTGEIDDLMPNPVLLLGEEEARKIIIDELRKEGINFDKTDYELKEVGIYRWRSCCFLGLEPSPRHPHLKLDGYSTECNIGFVFISAADYFRFEGWSGFTFIHYDLIKIAKGVQNALKRYGKITAAVFYDPVVKINIVEKLESIDEDERPQYSAPGQLIAQVRDFVKWMKKEDIKCSRLKPVEIPKISMFYQEGSIEYVPAASLKMKTLDDGYSKYEAVTTMESYNPVSLNYGFGSMVFDGFFGVKGILKVEMNMAKPEARFFAFGSGLSCRFYPLKKDFFDSFGYITVTGLPFVRLNGIRGTGFEFDAGVGYSYRFSRLIWLTGQLGFMPRRNLYFKHGDNGYEFVVDGIELSISLNRHFQL